MSRSLRSRISPGMAEKEKKIFLGVGRVQGIEQGSAPASIITLAQGIPERGRGTESISKTSLQGVWIFAANLSMFAAQKGTGRGEERSSSYAFGQPLTSSMILQKGRSEDVEGTKNQGGKPKNGLPEREEDILRD